MRIQPSSAFHMQKRSPAGANRRGELARRRQYSDGSRITLPVKYSVISGSEKSAKSSFLPTDDVALAVVAGKRGCTVVAHRQRGEWGHRQCAVIWICPGPSA